MTEVIGRIKFALMSAIAGSAVVIAIYALISFFPIPVSSQSLNTVAGLAALASAALGLIKGHHPH